MNDKFDAPYDQLDEKEILPLCINCKSTFVRPDTPSDQHLIDLKDQALSTNNYKLKMTRLKQYHKAFIGT